MLLWKSDEDYAINRKTLFNNPVIIPLDNAYCAILSIKI